MSRILPGIFGLFFLAFPLAAQELEIESSLVPRNLADRLIGIANDPTTIRLEGAHHIPSDSVVAGDLLVMGSLRLAGRVRGAVVVVDGDLEFEAGAEVSGDLVVVGGEIRGDEDARVGGALMAFQPPAGRVPTVLAERTRATSGMTKVGVQGRFDREGAAGFDVGFGDYNRVEGLPISFGPGFTTRGRNPLRTEALMVVRTEGRAPYQTDRLGYRIEAEQFLGGRREVRIGGGLFSLVTPIESWGLTDDENALSTFLFTSDQRDYFETRGGHAYLRVTPRAVPLDLRVGYREERMGAVAPQDPWTFFSRGQPWREQPIVAEGALRSVVGQLSVDTRDHLEEPQRGWLIRVDWREGLGGNLTLPTGTLPSQIPGGEPLPVELPQIDARFSTGFVDIRRYNSVGRGNMLNFRAVLGGSPSSEVLPPQAQLSVGGPGTLPGYPLFAGDCGARRGLLELERDGVRRSMAPSYGCDQVALFQAEYRGSLSGFFGWESTGRGRARRAEAGTRATIPDPRWVIFFDAGKGWAASDWGDFPRGDSSILYDAGLGFLIGDFGVYWAKPFGEVGGESTLTVRLGRRF